MHASKEHRRKPFSDKLHMSTFVFYLKGFANVHLLPNEEDPFFKKYTQHMPTKAPAIYLELNFSSDFPNSPPFARVVSPRFLQYSGHITIGGSLCTAQLTSDGWVPDTDCVGFFLQLHDTILQGDPKVDMTNPFPYSEQEARSAYERVANYHGWKVAKGFYKS